MSQPLLQQIFVTGLSGSGKTRLSKQLAFKLGLGFLDLDTWICKKAQAGDIHQIFQEHDEKTFRSLEKEAVQEVMGAHNHVIALGAGALMDTESQDAVFHSSAISVWLKISPQALAHAIITDTYHRQKFLESRPLLSHLKNLLHEDSHNILKDQLTQHFTSQLAAREAGYSRCDIHIGTQYASFDVCVSILAQSIKDSWEPSSADSTTNPS